MGEMVCVCACGHRNPATVLTMKSRCGGCRKFLAVTETVRSTVAATLADGASFDAGWNAAIDRVMQMLEGPPQLENVRAGVRSLTRAPTDGLLTCSRCGDLLPEDGGYGNLKDGRRCCTKACVRILLANDRQRLGGART